jgi:hypothetical protein
LFKEGHESYNSDLTETVREELDRRLTTA